jgi:rhombotail lipoprotein
VKTFRFLTGLVPILLGGCTGAGFDRAALQERLNNGTLQSPDKAIADARAARPQLRFPCRVAVYLKPTDSADWRWTPEDKAALEQCAAALKSEGLVTDVFPLPDMLHSHRGDLFELRLAAAKCGADVLLVVQGVAETDSYKNAAAVLNLTVLGGFVVPASHRDSLFMMEGCLFDVDNEYIYTGVHAEGVGKIVRPTFLIEDKDAIALAKTKAIGQFGEELTRRIQALAGKSAGEAGTGAAKLPETPR